jgi:hypothetical protein
MTHLSARALIRGLGWLFLAIAAITLTEAVLG